MKCVLKLLCPLVAHAYHINSISVNSDDETYLSADDLRINLWNFGISEQSFSKWITAYVPDRHGYH